MSSTFRKVALRFITVHELGCSAADHSVDASVNTTKGLCLPLDWECDVAICSVSKSLSPLKKAGAFVPYCGNAICCWAKHQKQQERSGGHSRFI